jgi:hypothetical protein
MNPVSKNILKSFAFVHGLDYPTKPCPDCDGEGKFETISECCGADREPDLGLCYECHDHCAGCKCEKCNGTGRVPVESDDLDNIELEAQMHNGELRE